MTEVADKRSDRAVALQLKADVEETAGARATRRNMSTLLHLFGARRWTDDARARVSDSLKWAGLSVDPSVEEAEEDGSVRLSVSPKRTAIPHSEVLANEDLAALTFASLWTPGEAFRKISLTKAPMAEGILWIDMDHELPQALAVEALGPLLGEDVDVEDIAALWQPASASRSAGERGDPRHIAIPHVRVAGYRVGQAPGDHGDKVEEAAAPPGDKIQTLEFRGVDIFVGRECVLTRRRPGERVTGISHPEGGLEPFPLKRMISGIEREWRGGSQGSSPTAGDLGVLGVLEVLQSHRRARAALWSRLEAWEDSLLDLPDDRAETIDQTPLVALRALLGETRRRIPLDGLGESKAEWVQALTWPEKVVDVDKSLRETLDGLAAVEGGVRSASQLFDGMLAARRTALEARHIDLAELHAQRTDRLLSLVAALLGAVAVTTLFGGSVEPPVSGSAGQAAFIAGCALAVALVLGAILWRSRLRP